MRLSRALKDKLMDVRLRDKLLAEEKLTKSQTEEYLNSLEDESNNFLMTADVEAEQRAESTTQSEE